MKNLPLLIGSLAITIAAVIGVSFLFTKKANAPAAPVDQKLLVSDTSHLRGAQFAKVTVTEFGDFQCPACKATQPLVDQIMKQYDGKVNLVFRHFPLRSVHQFAALAARAAEAANKQGAFWGYHDKLYEMQDTWAAEVDPTDTFASYAKDLKLDVAQFKKDLSDQSLDDRITKDEADGNALGVNATPTFYVNGIKTDSQDLTTAIDKDLQ